MISFPKSAERLQIHSGTKRGKPPFPAVKSIRIVVFHDLRDQRQMEHYLALPMAACLYQLRQTVLQREIAPLVWPDDQRPARGVPNLIQLYNQKPFMEYPKTAGKILASTQYCGRVVSKSTAHRLKLFHLEILSQPAIKDDAALGKGFCVGHSYFCTDTPIDDVWLHGVVEYELIPLIQEYWFDESEKVTEWQSKLREAIR